MRAFGRDLIRGGHYGQRSCEPHLKAEHMAAPTSTTGLMTGPVRQRHVAYINSKNAIDFEKGEFGSENSRLGPIDRGRDNVFVERLWRSVKYEEVYLRAYESVGEARNSIGRYLDFYNRRRPHSSLDGSTPDQAYLNSLPLRLAA